MELEGKIITTPTAANVTTRSAGDIEAVRDTESYSRGTFVFSTWFHKSTISWLAGLSWWLWWWFTILGHALYPGTYDCLQTPGGVTAVCWNANLSPTTPQLLWFPHLSQDMFITHSFGSKISVGTRHPGCVMNPPAACLVMAFQIEGSPSSPFSFTPPCPSHVCGSVLYSPARNISQQVCTQRGLGAQFQRTWY